MGVVQGTRQIGGEKPPSEPGSSCEEDESEEPESSEEDESEEPDSAEEEGVPVPTFLSSEGQNDIQGWHIKNAIWT